MSDERIRNNYLLLRRDARRHGQHLAMFSAIASEGMQQKDDDGEEGRDEDDEAEGAEG